jgi:hypothetical protein
MRFKDFLLIEKKDSIEHAAELICHKIHDMVDNSHVESEDGSVSFDLGRVIKNTSYKGVTVVITNNQDSDGDIVVVTNEKIDRSNLKQLIANKKVYDNLLQNVKEFLVYNHDYKDASEEDLSTHEKQALHSSKETFDQKYDALIKAFKESLTTLTDEVAELNKELENTGLNSKRESIKQAIKILVDEKVGKDYKDFQKKILKLKEADFVAHISGDLKKMLQSRLHDFYEGYLRDEVKNFVQVD